MPPLPIASFQNFPTDRLLLLASFPTLLCSTCCCPPPEPGPCAPQTPARSAGECGEATKLPRVRGGVDVLRTPCGCPPAQPHCPGPGWPLQHPSARAAVNEGPGPHQLKACLKTDTLFICIVISFCWQKRLEPVEGKLKSLPGPGKRK